MAIIKTDAPSMSEVLCGVRLREAQSTFLYQIDKMVDWRPIRTFINKKLLLSDKTFTYTLNGYFLCILLIDYLKIQR